MYEEIFPEDPASFVDYYYQWKTKENEILVMEEDGMCQVMLHLNPYTLWLNRHLKKVPYIVAVATWKGCRRKGKMGRVMERALQDLEKQQVPFAFLLPADPAYYRGQGFVFFPSQRGIGPAKAQEDGVGAADAGNSGEFCDWDRAGAEDIPELVAFSNTILQREYHIFIKRDAQYYRRLFAEIGAEHGGILLLKSTGHICEEPMLKGILVYGIDQQENRAEIRELLLAEDMEGQQGPLCKRAFPGMELTFSEFQMMLRIASLKDFVSVLKREIPCCYRVKVKDSIIPQNCGRYQIELCRDGGRMQEIPEEDVQEELEIGELAQLLLADVHVSLREWV